MRLGHFGSRSPGQMMMRRRRTVRMMAKQRLNPLRTYYVSGMILNNEYVLTHLILTAAQWVNIIT